MTQEMTKTTRATLELLDIRLLVDLYEQGVIDFDQFKLAFCRFEWDGKHAQGVN